MTIHLMVNIPAAFNPVFIAAFITTSRQLPGCCVSRKCGGPYLWVSRRVKSTPNQQTFPQVRGCTVRNQPKSTGYRLFVGFGGVGIYGVYRNNGYM